MFSRLSLSAAGSPAPRLPGSPAAAAAAAEHRPVHAATLLTAIGDVAHPAWRARSVGIYRLWRDGGFAVGALLSGLLADAFGIPAAVAVVAALTAASGLIVAARMRGDDHRRTGLPVA